MWHDRGYVYKCVSFQAIFPSWASSKEYTLAIPGFPWPTAKQSLSQLFLLELWPRKYLQLGFTQTKVPLSQCPRERLAMTSCLQCGRLLSLTDLVHVGGEGHFPHLTVTIRNVFKCLPLWGGGKQGPNCPNWGSLFLGCNWSSSSSCGVCNRTGLVLCVGLLSTAATERPWRGNGRASSKGKGSTCGNCPGHLAGHSSGHTQKDNAGCHS